MIGPGTALRDLIHSRFRIPPCKSCEETMILMDIMGPQTCREQVEFIADMMEENARKRLITRLLAAIASRDDYRDLILEACEIAETPVQA